MNKTAEERITQSRVRLLLTKPFFGQLAVRLKIEDASSYIPTAATDGRRFMFNRDFVNSLPDEMLDFLVGHEVLHCVFDHMQARGDRKPQLYNAAADYNINMTLVEQNIGKPITEDKLEGGKICLDWKYSGWNSYEIYDDLLKNQQDAKGMDVHMDEIESGDDGEGEGAGVEMSEEEKKALADEIKQATIQAAQAAGEGVPDVIKRMISELVAPKMDWRDILRTQLVLVKLCCVTSLVKYKALWINTRLTKYMSFNLIQMCMVQMTLLVMMVVQWTSTNLKVEAVLTLM